jgi:hypothetical protein
MQLVLSSMQLALFWVHQSCNKIRSREKVYTYFHKSYVLIIFPIFLCFKTTVVIIGTGFLFFVSTTVPISTTVAKTNHLFIATIGTNYSIVFCCTSQSSVHFKIGCRTKFGPGKSCLIMKLWFWKLIILLSIGVTFVIL